MTQFEQLLKSLPTASKNNRPTSSILPIYLQQGAKFILNTQLESGAIPWFASGKLDPWDHIEAAMGLSVAGYHEQAERAYFWLRSEQLVDGGWLSNYFCDADEFTHLRQTHFLAYIATGVWHHFLITGNIKFIDGMMPCVSKAIDRVLQFQQPEGDISWAYNEDGQASDDALLTGCSSILRSLDCAIKLAKALKLKTDRWCNAAERLAFAIAQKPWRFDRNCESKKRFAMDWYYPVISGAHSTEEAIKLLDSRWHEFIEPGLGCRCVSDEPWVTMAETSELVISLVSCGRNPAAMELFFSIQDWRDPKDGGYWTGYALRDECIWPEEKTSWTAGAVLLAADALFSYTDAHDIFAQPLCI